MQVLTLMPSNLPPLLAPQALDDVLLYRLGRIQAVAGSMVVRWCEGQYGITRREWRLIGLLAESGSLQPSQLAERAQLDRARTSKAITALVAKKLLSRQERPDDRRQIVLTLTPEGRSIYDALYPQVVALNTELLAELTTTEVSSLDAVLSRLQRQAETVLAKAILPRANRRLGKTPSVVFDS